MRWESGAVCIMSPIKRDQSWRGAVELLYNLQMTRRHHCTAWRGLPEKWEEGSSTRRLRVVRLRSVLFGFARMLRTRSFRFTCDGSRHTCGLVLTQRYYICPGGCVCFFVVVFFCPPHRPPLPSQLKHQIMNSLFQQEAIRTECSFKFQLITNNLHLHSREL